jgi:hypothetical protein
VADAHEAVELAGKQPKWRLILAPDAFRLEPLEAGESIDVPRAERVKRVELFNGVLARRILAVTLAPGRKLFRLDPAGYAAYEAWAGPPTMEDLRKSLKRRFGWSVALGALIILTSVPLPGDPEAGVPALPLNPLTLAMGIALIAAGLMSRLMPSRVFILADCLWIAIAAVTTVENLLESPGIFGAVLLALQANYVVMSIQDYRRYGAMKEEADPPGAPA